jgi:hypothetical protein
MYAPETLPEKVMKERDLKSYVEKAMKKVQTEKVKADQQEPEPSKETGEDSDAKPQKDEGEYEEAQKLAEKYY